MRSHPRGTHEASLASRENGGSPGEVFHGTRGEATECQEDVETLDDLERRAVGLVSALAEEADTQKRLLELIGSVSRIIESVVESQHGTVQNLSVAGRNDK